MQPFPFTLLTHTIAARTAIIPAGRRCASGMIARFSRLLHTSSLRPAQVLCPLSSRSLRGSRLSQSPSTNPSSIATRSFRTTLPKHATMATDTVTGQLAGLLEKLSLGQLPSYPNCNPDLNPVDIFRAHITLLLHNVSGVDESIIYPVIQWTASLENGDLQLPIPALRIKGKKPAELSEEWLAKWPESPLIEKPKAVNNGAFLTFFFKPGPLSQLIVPRILAQTTDYGKNPKHGLKNPEDPSSGKKRMVVEFSSPNIAKPFHAGHLRSTIIGGFLANLYAVAGWDVVRINYLGDWGKQYGLLALGFERYGDEASLAADPINHLFQVYVKINNDLSAEKDEITALEKDGKDVTDRKANSLDEKARGYFRAMTVGDDAALAQWRRFRDLSIAKYRETYARLNVEFDEYSGESQVSDEAMVKSARIIDEKGLSEESDGAVIIPFAKHVPGKAGKSLEKPVIKKRDGTALYLTRDISELQSRQVKYKFDKMIYVVASQQDLHLKQLFKIVELAFSPELAAKCQHINFGLVAGMSTRKGTVRFLDDIVRDVTEHMHEVMRKNEDKYKQVANPEQTAETLAITSIIAQDFTGKRGNGYTFDLNQMTSFEGDTGPYLQYAHARLSSITRRAGLSAAEIADNPDMSLLTEKHAVDLLRSIAQYPDVVAQTLRTLEPTTVLTYLFRMTHTLSSSYDHLRIVGSEPELLKARLALYTAAKQVLWNGMRLLGLSPVERM